MSVLLFWGNQIQPTSSLTLDFIDINGNPLPAGVRADIYAGSQASGTPVLSQYMGYGASVNAAQTLTQGSTYTCSFFGTQAPDTTVTFTAQYPGTIQTLTVPNYISSDPSQAGYAALMASLLPRGWFSDAALAAGGVTYNLLYALSWANAQMDQQIQETIAADRLQSSSGNEVDSWSYDFFGNNLPRNPGESDAAYIGRIEAMLAAKQSTPAGVAAVAGFFGAETVNEPWRAAETGAWDTNGVFAWDSVGGWGNQQAGIYVYVWANANVVPAYMKSTIMQSRPVGLATSIYSVSGNNATQL